MTIQFLEGAREYAGKYFKCISIPTGRYEYCDVEEKDEEIIETEITEISKNEYLEGLQNAEQR